MPVVEIRGKAKQIAAAQKTSMLDASIPFNVDESLPQLVVMVRGEQGPTQGQLFAWLTGDRNVIDFCRYGYRRILLECPIMRRRCIAEKCQLWKVQQGIGNCSISFAGDWR